MQEQQITSNVRIGPDSVLVCFPACRNIVLKDLKVKGTGGRHVYRTSGRVLVTVGWSGKEYQVIWKNRRASSRPAPCDLCAV